MTGLPASTFTLHGLFSTQQSGDSAKIKFRLWIPLLKMFQSSHLSLRTEDVIPTGSQAISTLPLLPLPPALILLSSSKCLLSFTLFQPLWPIWSSCTWPASCLWVSVCTYTTCCSLYLISSHPSLRVLHWQLLPEAFLDHPHLALHSPLSCFVHRIYHLLCIQLLFITFKVCPSSSEHKLQEGRDHHVFYVWFHTKYL